MDETFLNDPIICCVSNGCTILNCLRHTVPESMRKEAQGKDLAWYQNSLSDGSPVFIYLHGNTGTRYDKWFICIVVGSWRSRGQKCHTARHICFLENTNLLAHVLFVNHSNRAATHRVGVAKVSDHQHKHINLLEIGYENLNIHSDDE